MVLAKPFLKIKNVFQNSLFWKILVSILLFSVLILNSGYCYTYLLQETFIRTLVALISFGVIALVFLLVADFQSIKNRFITKRPTYSFILVCIICVSTILTMVFNKEIGQVLSYGVFILRIFSCYLLAKLLNFKTFLKIFQNGMFVLTIIALFFFAVSTITNVFDTVLPSFTSALGGTFINYFYLSFQSADGLRLQGLFWEPGLFASFLIIALIFEVLFIKKIRIHYVIVWILGILFTRSTFGIFCLVFVLLLLINKRIKKFSIFLFIYALFFVAFLVFAFFYKQILGYMEKNYADIIKKIYSSGKFVFMDTTRFQCPIVDFRIFLKNPIFGKGIIGALNEYAILKPGESQTSTTMLLLAQFGILGIVPTFALTYGIFKSKTLSIDEKILFFILVLIIANKEPHDSIWFLWFLMFLFSKEYVEHDNKSLLFDKISDNSLINAFTKKDDQSVVKRNVLMSFLIKGFALVISFFSYPIYLKFFNNDSVAGVWGTVLSLITMFISLDLGLGNGLKNKMIVAIENNDEKKKKELISSTYITSIIVSGVFLLVIVPIICLTNVNGFLNISKDVLSPWVLKLSIILIVLAICLEFVLKNITSLLQAIQKQALSGLFALLSSISLLLFAATVKFQDKGMALLYLSIFYIFTTNLPLLIGNILVFRRYFKGLGPSVKSFNKISTKEVMSLGLGFFALQLILLLINSSNDYLVSALTSNSSMQVMYAKYNKPFNIVQSIFSIITLSYWGIIAKEKENKNYKLIIKNVKQCLFFFGIFAFLAICLGIFFKPFVNYWLGEGSLEVSDFVVTLFVTFCIEWMLTALLSTVANGFSIIKGQIIVYIASAITKFVALLIFKLILKDGFQWYFVVISNVICYVPLIIGIAVLSFKEILKIRKEVSVK